MRLRNQKSVLFCFEGLDHKKDKCLSKNKFVHFVLKEIDKQIRVNEKIKKKYELVLLGQVIDWKCFCEKFGKSFHESQGRPGWPTRLMVGLTYLKYIHNLSDEKVIRQFLQSPYWQYFCGYIYFQKKAPLEASNLTRFREYLGEEGAKKLLRQGF